jgi:hypothetical protein
LFLFFSIICFAGFVLQAQNKTAEQTADEDIVNEAIDRKIAVLFRNI